MTSERVVVVYERVSTDRQDLTRQAVQRDRAASDYLDREVVVLPDDGVSAFKVPIFERPSGRQLCDMIAGGTVEAVYADAQDRLSRGRQSEWWNFADLCEQNGTRIVIDGRELRLDDEGDEIKSALDAMIARRESRNKSHRVKGGLREAARSGRLPTRDLGYGYRAVGRTRERRFVPDPAEVEIVRRIDAEYLGGRGTNTIARDLNTDGVRTRRGAKWSASAVGAILDSPVYVGLVRWGGEIYPGLHEPIRKEGTWEQVQRLRTARRESMSGGRGRLATSPHVFTHGLLRCGRCGAAMQPKSNSKGHRYYYCATRSKARECDMPTIAREKVDEAVLRYFESDLLDSEATVETIKREAVRHIEEARALVEHAERDLAKGDERLARVRRDYQDGRIDADDWREQRDDLTAERGAAASEVERLGERVAALEAELAEVNAEAALGERLAAIRSAVVGRVGDAEGLEALRAVLTATFENFELIVDDGGFELVPQVREDMLREVHIDPKAVGHAVLVAKGAHEREAKRTLGMPGGWEPSVEIVPRKTALHLGCEKTDERKLTGRDPLSLQGLGTSRVPGD